MVLEISRTLGTLSDEEGRVFEKRRVKAEEPILTHQNIALKNCKKYGVTI